MDKIREIIDKYTEGNYLISESDKENMSEDILNLFDVSNICQCSNPVFKTYEYTNKPVCTKCRKL